MSLVIGGRRDRIRVRAAEAVAGCTELGDALLFESGDDFIEGWAGLLCAMFGDPSHEIERARLWVNGGLEPRMKDGVLVKLTFKASAGRASPLR